MSATTQTTEAGGPGLLYVNSKITDPDKLSASVFTQWYEKVHIPDIFETSGIKSAYRYFTTSNSSTSVDRPYLALYPLKEVGFLQTDEFKAIPVHSDLVPTSTKCIFDVADFDTRYYTNVDKVEVGDDADRDGDPRPYLTTVQFDAPVELRDADPKEVSSWYLDNNKQGATRVRVYRLYFGRQNRNAQEDNNIATPHAFLAVHEFPSEDAANAFVGNANVKQTRAGFKLLKAFGNTKHNF
ncbi:hypothetical protein B0A52_03784 [Exophiala mesophila]|uniref:EthD domain-containing protein n=1 Tax=Exophiala mesophila TaxID=212818 RepID=A0A438N749_EXOME|nr:hypothetical protein B0A52_03784 [Exophiala mesophila]